MSDRKGNGAPFFRTFELSDPRYESSSLRHVTVKSAALRRRADITFYIPPLLDLASPSPPLVILLHGVYGSHWSWSLQGGAHLTAQSLIERQIIAPMILAMPSDGLWGDGSGYVRHAELDVERWIVEEVPAAAARVVGRDEQWPAIFLCGLSMGGLGALRLGSKYHRIIRGVSAHSAMTRFEQMRDFVEEDLSLYGTPAEDRDVLATILENRARLPPVRFDCGTGDPLIEHNRELHRQLTVARVPHRYEEFGGAHDWQYWHDHLADTLHFFNDLFRGAVS